MINKLKDMRVADLKSHIGLTAVVEMVIDTVKLKHVAKLLHEKTGEAIALCLYFSDDLSSPDLIMSVADNEEADEVLYDLEKCHKRNSIKVVKLNFNKEDNNEV